MKAMGHHNNEGRHGLRVRTPARQPRGAV